MARKADFGAVGKNQPRLDGDLKVTGRSLFADDVVLPGMLYGKILRSPHARARIVRIDTSKAKALPGVKAVITADDAPGVMVGENQPLFVQDVANYVGEEIAAVAALDVETATKALSLIEVEYEVLPAVLSMNKAMKPGAPVIHGQSANNIALENGGDFGEVDEAFENAAYVRSDEFSTSPSHNCFAEFHVVLADYSRPDKLSVWTPTQTALLFQKSLAKGFGLQDGQVQIHFLNTGGGFTGRSAIRPHHYVAALLSRTAGRPVKITASGDEEFIMCRAGGDVTYKFRTGVSKEGKIKVIDADFTFECGAHIESQAIVISLTASYLHMLFDIEAVRVNGRLVYTNHMPYYFHHGGGIGQMAFAFGQHIDRIAKDLGYDPVEFLLLNAVEKGHTTMMGTELLSCGLKECIKKASRKAGWKRKRNSSKPYRGIGIGIGAMASGAKGVFRHDTSAAFVKIQDDGSASLFTGLPDMGQSSHTTMAIIAAEVLGIHPTDFTVVSGDTDVAPLDVGAFTQRGTFNTGNAVKNACEDARKQIAKTAAAELGVKPSQLLFRDHKISVKANPNKSMAFADAVFRTLHSSEGRYVMGRGFYNSPKRFGSMAYSFGAQVAEVEIDPETGVVTVLKVTAAHDVGRAINPRIVEGQIDGQIFSAMSQVLYEECLMEEGQILNPSRLEYKMPRSYEMPEVEHIIVETVDPNGPFGAKEVGEGPIVCALPAIANAVANALGEHIHDMPITPWKVLRVLKRQKPRQLETA